MKRLFLFAFALGFASWVSASDFNGSIYQEQCVYAKLNPGLAFIQDIDVKRFGNLSPQGTTISVQPAFGSDLVLGYNCTENIAIEFEPGYFISSLDSVTIKGAGTASAKGDVGLLSTFGNVVLHSEGDFLSADLGLGVGQMTTWASLNQDTLLASSASSMNSTLAFQLKAGLECRVSERSTIGLAYKFVVTPLEQQFVDLKVGSVMMHKIELSWTYSF